MYAIQWSISASSLTHRLNHRWYIQRIYRPQSRDAKAYMLFVNIHYVFIFRTLSIVIGFHFKNQYIGVSFNFFHVYYNLKGVFWWMFIKQVVLNLAWPLGSNSGNIAECTNLPLAKVCIPNFKFQIRFNTVILIPAQY